MIGIIKKTIVLLSISKGVYENLYRSFPLLCLILIPCFYTFIIYPFYGDEQLYQWFALENTFFWIVVFFSFLLFSKIKINFKLKTSYSYSFGFLLIISFLFLFLLISYIFLNVVFLGWSGFFSTCHYCGPTPFGGDGLRNIILFDLGTVFILMLPFYSIYFKKKKVFLLLSYLCAMLILYYFFVGSYRNQILPIITQWALIFIFMFRAKKILFTLFLCLSPIAAIAMAFFHYFGGGKTSTDLSLYDYFALNEFYSNYNNFKIYNFGFTLDLPFPGASYIGPLLHRLSSFIDTGFKTSASQMATYMSDGIGYGFSPLLEGLLNFGDLYFVAAVIISFTLFLIYFLIRNATSDLMALTYLSLFIFFVYNINRVDYTAAFNIFFHKTIICAIFFFLFSRQTIRE